MYTLTGMASEPETPPESPNAQPLVGQHICEIRATAAAVGWVEDPPLTFTTETGAWPITFQVDEAGNVTSAAWAQREPVTCRSVGDLRRAFAHHPDDAPLEVVFPDDSGWASTRSVEVWSVDGAMQLDVREVEA